MQKKKGLYIILDVKRETTWAVTAGELIQKAYLGKVDIDGVECEPCPVDCNVAVNPYLGTDGIQVPFVNDCKTFD